MPAIPFLLMLAFALGGCSEAIYGPRVVTSDSDVFYIRYLPWRNSRSGVALLADSVCAGSGRTADLQGGEQYAWLDVRYVTFLCSEPPTAAGEEIEPGA